MWLSLPRTLGITSSRLRAASRLMMATATITGLMTRPLEMPAASSAVSSWWLWIEVTVNMAAISVKMPLVRSKNDIER